LNYSFEVPITPFIILKLFVRLIPTGAVREVPHKVQSFMGPYIEDNVSRSIEARMAERQVRFVHYILNFTRNTWVN